MKSFLFRIRSFFRGKTPVREVQAPTKSYEEAVDQAIDKAIYAHPVYGWLCHSANARSVELTPVQRSFFRKCGEIPRDETIQEGLDRMWKTKTEEAVYNFG